MPTLRSELMRFIKDKQRTSALQVIPQGDRISSMRQSGMLEESPSNRIMKFQVPKIERSQNRPPGMTYLGRQALF